MNSIAITMGDPKGIGPEIIAKAWKALSPEERASVRIYGDHAILNKAHDMAGITIDPKHLVITSSTDYGIGEMRDDEGARITLSALDAAIEDVLEDRVSSLVTAPLNKRRMHGFKQDFTGHTEYLEAASGSKDAVMMFCGEISVNCGAANPSLGMTCISLATMHIRVCDVPKAITRERVSITIRRTHEALTRQLGHPEPRIAVMSLNPHAGEGGLFGTEEKKAISPAIEGCRKDGINCIGPIPADSLFRNLKDFDYDAVVAMFHDQGLLPAKILCQGTCVNVTLGLPFVRTSPGHGTAEDIAWLGKADPTAMIEAIKLAARMTGKQKLISVNSTVRLS